LEFYLIPLRIVLFEHQQTKKFYKTKNDVQQFYTRAEGL